MRSGEDDESPTADEARNRLAAAGIQVGRPQSLPFVEDATAGSETELQAAVLGPRYAVDLPQTILASNYFADVLRRAASGDPSRVVSDLEGFLENNPENVWDNSWVRFPRRRLSSYAESVFENDLRADKSDPSSGPRGDADSFRLQLHGEEYVRTPISYLLKLALADALGVDQDPPQAVRAAGVRLMSHFLSDNTSPETYSFHIKRLTPRDGRGRALAAETAQRYLFCQLLIAYAARAFGLRESGQEPLVFASPHPPIRQRRLNDCIADSFYRELFMNPCLSGWDRGEAKRAYMTLCHQTLSRSQLNAVSKLREAGIITRNLTVLPNTSNICLANNGAHISLGSAQLAALAADPGDGPQAEKYFGDLAIKIVEHFLPLFIGTYSAAPYRLDYQDFHPEKALGFLPHQLDYTHLRMIWRRWKGKTKNRIFGHPFCPWGPQSLDRAFARLFGLAGDFVPDFRLLDYLVAPMSTERSPALDGQLGNEQRLRADLDKLGVFDERMTFYSLFRLRGLALRGFSGFEARHYSLFESFGGDMAQAVDLQALLCALAYRYIAGGEVAHADIPDRPFVESERRQVLFAAAMGVPTFFVDERSPNAFLLRLLRRTERTRPSRRYPRRLRVHVRDYRLGLLETIEADAPELVEAMGLTETLRDLRSRILQPDGESAAAKLTRGVLAETGARTPFRLNGEEFNLAAERFYRGALRRRQMGEAVEFLQSELASRTGAALRRYPEASQALWRILRGKDAIEHLNEVKKDLLSDRLPLVEIQRLLHLMLVAEYLAAKDAA